MENEILNNDILLVVDGRAVLSHEMAGAIAEFERQVKMLKDLEETLKRAILETMEETNTLKVDTDILTITYVPPTDRERFDSKRFRAEHGDLYDEYVSMSPVKASVRIKIK